MIRARVIVFVALLGLFLAVGTLAVLAANSRPITKDFSDHTSSWEVVIDPYAKPAAVYPRQEPDPRPVPEPVQHSVIELIVIRVHQEVGLAGVYIIVFILIVLEGWYIWKKQITQRYLRLFRGLYTNIRGPAGGSGASGASG